MIIAQRYHAKIQKVNHLTEKVYQVILELLEPKSLEFNAGQFLMLEIKEGVKRAYSLASLPSLAKEKGTIELLIDITPGGPASNYFQTVARGTECNFMAPYGMFSLKDTDNDVVFLAGSTGLAPFRSMIFQYYETNNLGLGTWDPGQNKRKIFLFLGVHGVKDQFLVEEFKELEKKEPTFKFFSVVSELVNKPGEHGSVIRVMAEELSAFAKSDLATMDKRGVVELEGKNFYLCGAPNFVALCREKLLELGVGEENIYNEKY